jgi:putative membrane protein
MNAYIKDALYGAIGGVAGTLVIGKVMSAFTKAQSKEDQNLEKALVQEEPTQRLARRMSKKIVGKSLTRDQKAALGQAIHWGYGIFWGAVYGVLRRRSHAASLAGGLPFGVGFAMFGNTLMLPLMKLTPPAHKFPLSSQVRGIVSHYAYAATVDCVARTAEAVEEKVNPQPKKTKPELRRVS